jgi:hypothetical protein
LKNLISFFFLQAQTIGSTYWRDPTRIQLQLEQAANLSTAELAFGGALFRANSTLLRSPLPAELDTLIPPSFMAELLQVFSMLLQGSSWHIFLCH